MGFCAFNKSSTLDECVKCTLAGRCTSSWGEVKEPLKSAILGRKFEECKNRNNCKGCEYVETCSSMMLQNVEVLNK